MVSVFLLKITQNLQIFCLYFLVFFRTSSIGSVEYWFFVHMLQFLVLSVSSFSSDFFRIVLCTFISTASLRLFFFSEASFVDFSIILCLDIFHFTLVSSFPFFSAFISRFILLLFCMLLPKIKLWRLFFD